MSGKKDKPKLELPAGVKGKARRDLAKTLRKSSQEGLVVVGVRVPTHGSVMVELFLRNSPETSEPAPRVRTHPVEDLGLTGYLNRILRDAGVTTAEQLRAMSTQEVSDIRNVGAARAVDIAEALLKFFGKRPPRRKS